MAHDVRDFYNGHAEQEWERLESVRCKIEFVSTLHLIWKYFPEQGRGHGAAPGTIEERNPLAYANVVHVAAETCELPQYRDSKAHLHVVARRPD